MAGSILAQKLGVALGHVMIIGSLNVRVGKEEMQHNEENSKICISCQECCKWLTFTIAFPEDVPVSVFWNNREFYEARGCKLFYPNNKMTVMVPSVCKNLASKGCRIWKTSPTACLNYDGRYDPLMKKKCRLPA
jgi:hypothetical protein